MPEKWTGDVVAKMHINKITQMQLSQRMGITNEYLCQILNGKKEGRDMERRCTAALNQIIAEREEATE